MNINNRTMFLCIFKFTGYKIHSTKLTDLGINDSWQFSTVYTKVKLGESWSVLKIYV